jgi:acyl-CoA thioesterase FadM
MHGLALFTASMNVRFERLVKTPQIVLATASLDRIEGRKVYLKTALAERDGASLARGGGMWLSVSQEHLAAAEKL